MKNELSAADFMPGDESQPDRLLCVAETIDEAAIHQAQNIVAISEELLLGKPPPLRFKTNQGGIKQIRHRSWSLFGAAIDESGKLKGNRAEEIRADND